jgi:hypothetical protein
MNYGFEDIVDGMPLAADISIRDLVHNTLYGTEKEMPRGRWLVWQKLKRDSEGQAIKSPFVYKITEEGKYRDRGYATTRTGYLCDEYLIRGFITPPSTRLALDETQAPVGVMPNNRVIIWTSYKDAIHANDIIILPKIDTDGNLINPVAIDMEYMITMVYNKTLDNGRLEFFQAVGEIQK